MATTKQNRKKSGSAIKVKGKGAKAAGGSRRPQAAGRKTKSDASATPRDPKRSAAGRPAAKRTATASSRAGHHEANGRAGTFRDGSKGSTIVSLLKLKGGATIAAAVETSDEANRRHGVGIDANERHAVEPDHRSNDGTTDILRALFDRVTISRDTVSIALSRDALMDDLIDFCARIEPSSADEADARPWRSTCQPIRCAVASRSG